MSLDRLRDAFKNYEDLKAKYDKDGSILRRSKVPFMKEMRSMGLALSNFVGPEAIVDIINNKGVYSFAEPRKEYKFWQLTPAYLKTIITLLSKGSGSKDFLKKIESANKIFIGVNFLDGTSLGDKLSPDAPRKLRMGNGIQVSGVVTENMFSRNLDIVVEFTNKDEFYRSIAQCYDNAVATIRQAQQRDVDQNIQDNYAKDGTYDPEEDVGWAVINSYTVTRGEIVQINATLKNGKKVVYTSKSPSSALNNSIIELAKSGTLTTSDFKEGTATYNIINSVASKQANNKIVDLIKLANHLDNIGMQKEADYLDSIIKMAQETLLDQLTEKGDKEEEDDDNDAKDMINCG